jgi:hypothetical protein
VRVCDFRFRYASVKEARALKAKIAVAKGMRVSVSFWTLLKDSSSVTVGTFVDAGFVSLDFVAPTESVSVSRSLYVKVGALIEGRPCDLRFLHRCQISPRQILWMSRSEHRLDQSLVPLGPKAFFEREASCLKS